MAGAGLLSVDPEQPIFGNILPRAALYGFKGSLRTGQIPRFRQCDAKAGIAFIGVDRSLMQSQPVKRCRRPIIAIAHIGVTDGRGTLAIGTLRGRPPPCGTRRLDRSDEGRWGEEVVGSVGLRGWR